MQKTSWVILLSLALLLILVISFSADPLLDGSHNKIVAARSQLEVIAKAIEQYNTDVGVPLDPVSGLSPLVVRPSGVEGWKGPYLSRIPKDPWGNDYVYVNHSSHRIISYGVDGRPGGTGANSDITVILTEP